MTGPDGVPTTAAVAARYDLLVFASDGLDLTPAEVRLLARLSALPEEDVQTLAGLLHRARMAERLRGEGPITTDLAALADLPGPDVSGDEGPGPHIGGAR